MADERKDLPFRTLLIEDNPDWVGDMQKAWGKGLDVASTGTEARRLLAANRYHFITVDQNLPEHDGSGAVPDVGVELCRRIVSDHPCSPRVLFTAFADVTLSNRIGRMDATEYWQKSGTGKDNPASSVYSARGWAQSVRDFLAERYLPFALQQAGRFLPANLADQARNLEKHLGRRSQDSRFLGFAIDLWQSTLHLSWAQAQALARVHRGGVGTAVPTNKLEELERGLGLIWPELSQSGWFGPWGAYVGKGNAKTGDGAGRRFLVEASRPLRSLRNAHAHDFTREVWTDRWEALENPLLHLLDAAILWADHPLLTGLRAAPGRSDLWQAEAIHGAGPWPAREVLAASRFAPYPERVYIRWLDPEGAAVLVDLWPFVILEADPKINRRVLWVPSHCDPGGNWWRRSLYDGQVMRWPERDREGIKTLQDHFRGAVRPLH